MAREVWEMARKAVKRGLEAEKRKARELGAEHLGGPGKPDYRKGQTKGEVKARATPVSKPELQELASKGINRVDSKAGFTRPAIEYRNRYRPKLKLFHRGKAVK
jgi:hypothetical protein